MVLQEAEAENVVLLRLHRNSLAVPCVVGVVMDVLVAEGAAVGSRPAMTAQGVHRDSVAAVAGKQAEFEVAEVERSAKMAATMQRFLADVGAEHCFAMTAAAI